jgi:ankyrin repeat protein
MAGQGQGQGQMTQEELNYTLYDACGCANGQARAEELLGRGAAPNALVNVVWNALHRAARWGREQIVAMLLSKGAVLRPRGAHW